MKIGTCVYIITNQYVQMAEQQGKIPGFIGYGGKQKEGQTLRENATEEIWEETGGESELRINPEEEGGIYVKEKWLEPAGMIDFYNGSEEEIPFGDPSFRVYFFISRRKLGKAVDTIEVQNHQLFHINALPLDKMVKGDDLFIPRLLHGVCLRGWVRRNKEWVVTSHSLTECTKESLDF